MNERSTRIGLRFTQWVILASLSAVITLSLAPARAQRVVGRAAVDAPHFTVVPPGPVSDRGDVELRLAVPNPTKQAAQFRVRFYHDRADADHVIGEPVVNAPAGGFGLARAWWKAAGQVGKHELLYRVELPGSVMEGRWPLTVTASKTRALSKLQAGWIEPLALAAGVYGRDRDMGEDDLRALVDAVHRLGMDTLIIAYVEMDGSFFYPSEVRFIDRDRNKETRGQRFDFDVVGAILAQAEKNGMHVFLGLGRAGDLNLLWEFDKPGWHDRNRRALDVGRKVAEELWRRYGRYRSLYGWYLTHEMNDLAKASAYYDPLADFCHSFSPDKPVMVAPAGTPKIERVTLESSHADIFCYQDAVGTGYVPYQNTYDPAKRLAQLDQVFSWYSKLHAGSGKHLWADLEIWERGGPPDTHPTYAAPMPRVRDQIAIEARYAEMVTAYSIVGFLEPPGLRSHVRDPRARQLYETYAAWIRQTFPEVLPPPAR
jgi:hypothetical protein